ncbi:protein-tyrosine-phosphatase [Maribacter sp. 2307ULW6-5]|uniref:protein-tyrosine-phosphatase n=1 Tax=Maribacter sp. 2307ULW6-5 TaxID=3386275 RepID=UPI0039BD222B
MRIPVEAAPPIPAAAKTMALYKKLGTFVSGLDVTAIPEDRKKALQPLIDFLVSRIREGKDVHLNFICTHNSRRSHLAQVWAQTLAHHLHLSKVHCYSGGTEATALYPEIVRVLRATGFCIDRDSQGKNPVYHIQFAREVPAVKGFSKKWDAPGNPKSQFMAIMTCASANESCPVVAGAQSRAAITYTDPKGSDGTPEQAVAYQACSALIATELLYALSRAKSDASTV